MKKHQVQVHHVLSDKYFIPLLPLWFVQEVFQATYVVF